jgi:hypothetical protein
MTEFDLTPHPKVLIALTHTPLQPLDSLCERLTGLRLRLVNQAFGQISAKGGSDCALTRVEPT